MDATQRRFISGTRLPEDIKSFTLSRGSVGRKVFNKGWSHLEPRYPINIQERFHRAAVERVFHPNIVKHNVIQQHFNHNKVFNVYILCLCLSCLYIRRPQTMGHRGSLVGSSFDLDEQPQSKKGNFV